MPFIKPDGLLKGDRLRSLSDKAKLYWPYLYAASNGYGRIRLEYYTIINNALDSFAVKPTETEIEDLLLEYQEKFLLFLYEGEDGEVWGAWDCKSGQRYFTAADKRSPVPPEPDFTNWKKSYTTLKQTHRKHNTASVGGKILHGKVQKQKPLFDISENFPQNSGNISESFCENAHNTTQHIKHNTITQQVLNTTLPTDGGAGGEPLRATEAEIVEPPQPPANAGVLDESWLLFREAAALVGMDATEDEWFTLQTVTWPRTSIAAQLAAIRGIYARREGEYRDPAFVHTAWNYLTGKLWTRPPRPVPKTNGTATTAKDKANREFEERMLQMQARKAIAK